MQVNSLCKFPQCPGADVCRACIAISHPRKLRSGDLLAMTGSLKSTNPDAARRAAIKPNPAATMRAVSLNLTSQIAAQNQAREAALRAQVEAARAENLRLKGQASRPTAPPRQVLPRVTLAEVVQSAADRVHAAYDPDVTAPNPEARDLAPAPAPLPAPVAVVTFPPTFGELKRGDWIGLSARVDAGVLTQAEAERIGSTWINSGGALTASA